MKTSIHPALSWAAIILLSAMTVAISIYVAIKVPSEKYAPIVSLAGTTASILAVVWFTTTLIYQSRQLREQRQQFALTFEHSKRDSQREALVVIDGILRDAESTALSQNPSLKSLAELIPNYVDFTEMSVMLKSTDPNEVADAGKEWIKREGPAVTVVTAIRTATKVYAESTGDSSFDFSKEAEEFVYTYGPRIWHLPYFQRYQGIANTLSEFMVMITPGRKAALLAYTIAIALSTLPDILNREKIAKDIEVLRRQNYPIPEIARGF